MREFPHACDHQALYIRLDAAGPAICPERGTDDNGIEMMAIAGHLDMIAREILLDVGLYLLRGDHRRFSMTQLVAAFE
jgi:hypothetical protein